MYSPGHIVLVFKKAPAGRRIVAFLIDVLILGVVGSFVTLLLGSTRPVEYFTGSILYFGYNILMDRLWKGTIGKLLVGINVVDRNGEQPSLFVAAARNFAKFLSATPYGWGFLVVLAPHVLQTTRDKFSGCYVVNANADLYR